MIEDEKDVQIEALKLLLAKRNAKIKILDKMIANYSANSAYDKGKYKKLKVEYNRLNDRFEANFKFHEYIKDVLDKTADLMENYDAVRKQDETVQERVQATSRKRRTREPHGASAGAAVVR